MHNTTAYSKIKMEKILATPAMVFDVSTGIDSEQPNDGNTRISSLNKHKITTSFSDKSHFIMLLEYMNTYTTTSHTSSIIFYWLSAGKLLPFY